MTEENKKEIMNNWNNILNKIIIKSSRKDFLEKEKRLPIKKKKKRRLHSS